MNLVSELVDVHIASGRRDRTAVVDDSGRLTYAELRERVSRLAAGLRAHEVAPGDRVILALPSGADLIAAWLAVQHAGAIAVTVSPTVRPRELRAIVDDCEPRGAIGAGLPCDDVPTWTTAGLDGAAGATDTPPHEGAPEDVAVIAYTTAADGRAHGACHSPAGMLWSAELYGRQVVGLTENDVVGGHPPMAFAYGLGALLVFPLRHGAVTAPAIRFDAEAILGLIARERVTVFFGTATCYRLLLRAQDLLRSHDLSSLRLCVSAGEPLEAAVSEAWFAATGVDLLDGLGTTELFHIVVSQRPGAVVHGALGRPVPDYSLSVRDDGMSELPAGVEGELAVRGPTGARYWRRPDLQQGRVRDGWTLTGDVVVRGADGLFWFGRRRDALIVSAGYNIAPREVEIALEEHPAVARAEVVPAPDPTRGTIVCARIALRSGFVPSTALVLELQQHTQQRLSPYKCPRQIQFRADPKKQP
jgi:2-aminobenzoate-CoA ligase